MKKNIKLSDIVTDAGTQVRAAINETTVDEYAEAYKDGTQFPELQVFADGNKYLLADGFHRYMAAQRAGLKDHPCFIRPGTRSDCLKFALGCNINHGLRRTNADKRHSVELALKEFPKASIAAIADMCRVSNELVSALRNQPADFGGLNQPKTIIGLDGRNRQVPVVQPNKAKTPPPIVKPVVYRDQTGHPIPASIVPLWKQAEEWQGVLSGVSTIRGILRKAQEDKDPTAAEINFSSVLAHLDQAYTDIKTAKPFAVCPTCAGKVPEKCTLCLGRGFLSEHRWNTCVSREVKEVRAKTRKA